MSPNSFTSFFTRILPSPVGTLRGQTAGEACRLVKAGIAVILPAKPQLENRVFNEVFPVFRRYDFLYRRMINVIPRKEAVLSQNQVVQNP